MRGILALGMITLLAACEVTTAPPPAQTRPVVATHPASPPVSQEVASRNFSIVVRSVEPVAERECRRRAPDLNCDFKIVVDPNPKLPANAFQTLDKSGRPIIGFTQKLIAEARNRDELAFVMGHETAHHIERHLVRQQQSAVGGAILGGILASTLGLDANIGQDIGGNLGARVFSKENELEADALGTVIAKRAGYNPVRGAQFFTRIPDPGDRFLGTHPPNAARIETVRRVNAQL